MVPRRRQTTGDGDVPDVAKRQLTLDGGATIDESLYQYDAVAMSFARHGPPGSASRGPFMLYVVDRGPVSD
jgi:hypothetical protein